MTNISSISQLLKEGKQDEARAILTEAISAPLSNVERGRALVTLAMVYMGARNTIDKEFLSDIKKTMETIRAVQATERSINDGMKLVKVRQSLK